VVDVSRRASCTKYTGYLRKYVCVQSVVIDRLARLASSIPARSFTCRVPSSRKEVEHSTEQSTTTPLRQRSMTLRRFFAL
jgi:hypothetical protein